MLVDHLLRDDPLHVLERLQSHWLSYTNNILAIRKIKQILLIYIISDLDATVIGNLNIISVDFQIIV